MHDAGPGETDRPDVLDPDEIIDNATEAAIDDLIRLASSICGTPIAKINLVEAEQQWFRPGTGLDEGPTPPEHSLCLHALRDPGVFIVPDARADPRFAAHPLVAGDPKIRFFAGAPLMSPKGWPLGSLCVIDREPRRLDLWQVEALRILSRQVVAQLELRLHLIELKWTQDLLQKSHDDIEHRIAARTAELARANRELQIEVEQRAAAEGRLQHEATHDALTGLPNRTLLHDRMGRAIADEEGRPFALLLLDLDRFKEINNTFGHTFGDIVLKDINPRLAGVFGETPLVARLGGDEFGILLPGADEGAAVRAAAEALRRLSRPIEVDGQKLDIGGTFGIALFPEHGRDPITLLRKADVAMYAAKRSHSGYAVYSDSQTTCSPRRLSMIAELRHGIEDGHLLLYYQPKIALAGMRPSGCEALVRWRHPVDGLIGPGEFIPLAEHTGLIRPLGLWTLDAAMRQARAWSRAGLDAHIAVNLGTENLHDLGLAATVSRVLGHNDTPPSRLTLEITESAMMADPERALRVLNQIHDLGVRIAIDDFGTGYSSLSYLKGLPVDEVKVDQSFVRDMATNPQDACIVRSVIDLGHNLGLRVVAEGVEDRATADLLAEAGCDYAQGYFFGRPVPPADFADSMNSLAES